MKNNTLLTIVILFHVLLYSCNFLNDNSDYKVHIYKDGVNSDRNANK